MPFAILERTEIHMTRKRIVFTDSLNRRFVSPELNGDKTEFELFGMGDQCTSKWNEIIKIFSDVSTLDEFKAASDMAQRCYISSIAPGAPPEPVIEINTDSILPDSLRNCELIFLPEVSVTECDNILLTGAFDLLDKLENVEIQVTDKFPAEDMEYCRQEEQSYQAAYTLYSEFSEKAREINARLNALPKNVYVQKVDENSEKLYDCNERFIYKICAHFRDKYNISINAPEWKTIKECTSGYGNRNTAVVPLQFVLDSVYEQMGGMSFEEKAFEEIKADAKRALTSYHGDSRYVIKGVKLIIADFYCFYKDRIWERYKAKIADCHRAFFKALSHFEYGKFDINQKYTFLCGRWEIDEKEGVYDKHFIHSSIIYSIKVFKNGKVEIEFKDYQTAVRFMETYFPGLPQKSVAA